MKNHFYITTTLPYVNSEPHIGFAMEIIRADIIARVKNLRGFNVFFNTGTDEHGSKIYENATLQSITPQEYVDRAVTKFKELGSLLGLATDVSGIKYNFIRTTDEEHLKSAQAFWQKCLDSGDIYKKNYKVKYCVGCELEKTDSELVDNKCPLHPNREIEIREEENYFFKFSKYQKALLDLYESNPNFVVPDFRQNEIKKFVERGLEDFSISRLKSKMPWGVDVPNDPEHAMYVWFDALVNYISAVGWPHNMDEFKKWWVETDGVVQYAGKDNLRQQSAMWQAMLASAGLPFSKQIVIDGFINAEGGVKMSKSLGNTVSPSEIIEEYSADALRYYMAREIMPFEDGVFTKERFKDAYNANLANGLGNLVSRIMKMASSYFDGVPDIRIPDLKNLDELSGSGKYVMKCIDSYELSKATDSLWSWMKDLDILIQEQKPFVVFKTDKEKAKKQVTYLLKNLAEISALLSPFLPETSKKIKELIKENKSPEQPLFLRKD